jgi:pyridoxamine 5'-phosphate oxidase family protein
MTGVEPMHAQEQIIALARERGETVFLCWGFDLSRTLKYKSIQVNAKLSLVIDDLETVDLWRPRGLKIHGIADLATHEGYADPGTYIRIKPEGIWSWGIEKKTKA